MLSVQEILNVVSNTGIEITLHFNHGFVAKGFVESSNDWIQSLPLILRAGDSKSGENFLMFEPSAVIFCSFADRRSLDLLFSAERIASRSTQAPSLLDLERLAHRESSLVQIKLNLENCKLASDEMKWRLHDLIVNLSQAIKELSADQLGKTALAQVPLISLGHQDNSKFDLQVSKNGLAIIFDLKSIWIEEKIQTKQLRQMIESHI